LGGEPVLNDLQLVDGLLLSRLKPLRGLNKLVCCRQMQSLRDLRKHSA
jgi:hypothetical protein